MTPPSTAGVPVPLSLIVNQESQLLFHQGRRGTLRRGQGHYHLDTYFSAGPVCKFVPLELSHKSKGGRNQIQIYLMGQTSAFPRTYRSFVPRVFFFYEVLETEWEAPAQFR